MGDVITIGAMVGPARDTEVIAVARIRDDLMVFIGKKDLCGRDEFVVSTFTEGETTWHSGFYTFEYIRALNRFVTYLDGGVILTVGGKPIPVYNP